MKIKKQIRHASAIFIVIITSFLLTSLFPQKVEALSNSPYPSYTSFIPDTLFNFAATLGEDEVTVLSHTVKTIALWFHHSPPRNKLFLATVHHTIDRTTNSNKQVLAANSVVDQPVVQQQLPQGLTIDTLPPNVINLLHNSSFEEQSGGQPRDWNYQLDATIGNTFISQEGNRSGNYGLKFVGGGTGNFGISQPRVKTIPQRTYTFSLYLKTTNIPESTILRFGFWDEYQNQEGQMNVVRLPSTEDWNRYTFTITTPGVITDSKNEFPLIEIEGLTNGAVYLDDASLTEGSIPVVYNTHQAYNSSYGIGDGSLIFTPEADIYPTYPGEGQLGTSTNQFESLTLTNASIDNNGNFLFKGGGTINGGLTLGSLTINGNTLFSSTQSALQVFNGGTGASNFTQYGVLYGNATNAIQALPPGISGYVLQSNGTNAAPSWVAQSGGGSTGFNAITSGTNTQAAMVVGSGASLNVSGSGTINASTVNGLTIAGGKTVTINNSFTFTGTDGTTMTFPTTSDTIAGLAATQTLTNKTIAAGSNTITGLTNSNLSGSAGITNANLANSALTITAGTGLSGGGSVSLGGSVTISLPQTIGTGSSPTFASLNLTNASNQLVLDTNGMLTWTPTQARSITFPDAGGTVAVSATSPITLSVAGAIGCATCVVSGGSLFTLAGTSGSQTVSQGNTLTIAAGTNITTTGASGPQVTVATVTNPTFSTSTTTPLIIGGTTASSNLQLESTSGTGTSDYLAFLTGSQVERARFDTNGKFGFNTTTPLALFGIRGNGSGTNAMDGTIAIASISGQTSFASLVIDQSGTGDILSASSSGLTHFRMTNNGSVLFQGNTFASIGTLGNVNASGSQSNSYAVANTLGDNFSMVPNAGFESTLSGFADGWVKSSTGSGSLAALDTATASQGNNSMDISATQANPEASIYSACFPITGNVPYTGSLGVNNTVAGSGAAPATVQMILESYTTKANCQTDTSRNYKIFGTSVNPGSGWANLTGAQTSPPGAATWARIEVYLKLVGATSQYTYAIDGVAVRPTNVTQGLDYAENYPADPANTPVTGDVVSLTSSGHIAQVAPARTYMDQNVIGVVSSNPGEVLDDGSVPDPKVPIALSGRVPVKISSKNGTIGIGDYLTSSDIPGVAVKATQPGQVIGKALENYTNTDPTAVGTITIFMNVGYADPASRIALTQNGDLSINNQPLGNNPPIQTTPFNAVTSTTPTTQQTSNNITIQQFNNLFSSISTLQNQLASMSAQIHKIDDLSQQVTDLQKAIDFNQLLAATSTQSAVLGASTSATGDTTISGNLNVLGRTVLSDVGITGRITSGLMSINGMDTAGATPSAAINTLSAPLKFQSFATAGIDFENSKVTIDTSGNVVIVGDITAKTVHTDKLYLKDNGDNASVGIAILPAGQMSVTVTTSALTNNSHVFVEPEDNPVTTAITKTSSNTFMIKINQSFSNDLKLHWWIVN